MAAIQRQLNLDERCSPIPATEWQHLVQLADPLIHVSSRSAPDYQLVAGQQLLLQLLEHYLDIC
ncbi:hypothetical protein [Hymenobacter wooponensis]|nr:hypothetical protein [Hymenobacter wooponensis]